MRVQKEKIQSGRKENKRFEARVRWECCISRGGQMGQVAQLRYTSWRSPGRSHNVDKGGISRRTRVAAGKAV